MTGLMTTTAVRRVPDDTSGVLAALRERQSVADAVEIDKLRLVVAWAAQHSGDSIAGPVSSWTEQPVVVAGEGAPEVAEFCVPELAVTLGISHDSAARLLGDAVELAYRLPRVYARVLRGELRVWKARRIGGDHHRAVIRSSGVRGSACCGHGAPDRDRCVGSVGG